MPEVDRVGLRGTAGSWARAVDWRSHPRPWPDLSWQADNEAAHADADGSLHWQPVQGAHRIVLLDAQDKTLDETRLVVKGRLIQDENRH